MNDPTLRAAIALHDRFTHEDWRADRSPGAISDGRGQSDPPMDRRAFMAELTRIAGGSAAAAMLLSSVACRAATPQVATDDARLRTMEQEWPVGEGRAIKGYMATLLPVTERPLVIVIHENRGLNDHIRDVARRIAVAGYTAVAPDFLSSLGGTPSDEDQARTMIGTLDLPATTRDAVATVNWFRNPRARQRRRVGAIGFCWGGAMVHRLAVSAGEALDAAVSFYGPAPDPSEAERVAAPELVILAGRDARVNATAGPWVAALRAAGKDVSEITYPDVDHAFHNDTSAARYNRAAAEQAWAATLAFFRQHLGA